LARRESGRPPFVVTSANVRAISMCAHKPVVRALCLDADLIHAEDMSLVFALRLCTMASLSDCVRSTDLFHDVAELLQGGQRKGAISSGPRQQS